MGKCTGTEGRSHAAAGMADTVDVYDQKQDYVCGH